MALVSAFKKGGVISVWMKRQKQNCVQERCAEVFGCREAQLCACTVGCFCLSLLCLWRRGQRMGEQGVGEMAEAPLCPVLVVCACAITAARCAVRMVPAQRAHLLHHSTFWFFISAAHLLELL